ncbi:efflux RND transporter permease subunit [Sporosarcina aquimarina]|uniref:efflux RND transporter permease subunit n=1 Tax=Sporosarcina aquimarina TaxID=114975 RepID=UPI00203C53D8|nr:efflux RND transporter permease subunit [Sporosarcina aquimarina]MCM3757252.1 efflux RND transporter permease subunit [Sporosarcina aquimarina]
MKKITNFALNNKFAVWILTIMVVVAGLYSGFNMKQETMPTITLPNVTVLTTYPGAAPDDVAEKVTVPIEQRIQNLDGVELVSSSSLANASSIQVQFGFKTDMDKATEEIKEALSKLSLPEGVKDPEVSRLSFDALPVMTLSVSDNKRTAEAMTTVVENDVLPALEGIEGVADVQITGQQLKKVTIDFDEEQLKKYGLSQDTIQQIIQGSDITFPLGLTNFDGKVKNLVIDGNIASVDDLKKLEIPAVPAQAGQMDQAQQGNPQAEQGNSQAQTQPPMEIPSVKLGDLAEIKVVSEAESISRTNGEDSIGIQIVKAADGNTVEVVNSVKDEISTIEKDLDLKVITTLDQGEPIEEAVSTMLSKALFGIIFAVLIILLFLRSIKTTLISIVSIPLSLLMAIFLLHQMDITLNLLTLGALTVAIGRVIDDSIVVMENIYRRMALPGEQLRGKELIREATRQMFIPIFSSTIVTIAVFLPIGLVGGLVGEMFLPFALAVAFALAASLIVAVTIVPMLAHSLYKKQLSQVGTKENRTKEEKPGKLANAYGRILEWTLNHKLITFGGSVVILVLSFFLVPLIGVSFLPDEEEKMIVATYSPDAGQTREDSEEIALEAEKYLSTHEGITTYQYSLGGGSPMDAMMGMGGSNSALFFIEYDKDFKNFSEETSKVIDTLNEKSEQGEWKSMDFGGMGGSGLQLFVYGDNKEDIEKATDQVLPILEDNKNLEKVESSLSEAYDQYTLVANQEKLSSLGLTAAQVGMNLMSPGEASAVTTVKQDGKELNVYIEVTEDQYKNIDELKNKVIQSPLGIPVKLGDVMEVEEGKTPDTIQRRDGKMYASLTADVKSKDVAAISSSVEKKISDLDLPSGVKVDFGGVTEQINESFSQLGIAMLAAVAIVYFVLVVTFGGALAPLAILFSLPFTIIGSLVALWIAGEPINVSAMIGALMLIGIVVTNAIVLIDRVIHQEKEGLSTREALLEAGSTRLRPILMTALATIGALIPLALGVEGGGGGLISKGLGVTVIGGLISSTLLTLVIVPIVYETFMKPRKKKVKR